jgi:hypothetical protein
MNTDSVTLIYTQDHPTLGLVRLEVTPRGHFPATVVTYINGQLLGRAGLTDTTLKGFTLVERRSNFN